MITIKINEQMDAQKDVNLDARAEFKMIDDKTATLDDYAIIEIYLFANDDLEEEKEHAANICERYTNGEIMQALALMNYRKDDHFERLPKYVDEFNRSLKSGEPMDFYDFIKNEDDLRAYLESEWIAENEENRENEINEYLKDCGDDYIYSPIGTLFLNRFRV